MRMTTMMAAVLLGAAAWPARAEEPAPGRVPQASAEYIEYQKKQDQQGPDPELETEHYDRQLRLSKAQRDKVRELFVEQRALFKKSYAERMKFQREVQALHERILEANKRFNTEGEAIESERAGILKRVRGLLDAKQQAAFDMMQAERDRAEREWKKRKEAEDVKRLGGDGTQGMFGGQEDRDKPDGKGGAQ